MTVLTTSSVSRRFAWSLALTLLALTWEVGDSGLWWITGAMTLLGAGGLALVARDTGGGRGRHSVHTLVLALATPLGLTLPAPYRLPVLLLCSSGVVLGVFGARLQGWRPAWNCLAVVVVLQSVLSLLLVHLGTQHTVVPGLAPAAATLLRFLGVEATAQDGIVLLFQFGEPSGYRCDVEKLGFSFLVQFLSTWLVVWPCVTGVPRVRFLTGLFGLLGYGLLRFVTLVLVAQHFNLRLIPFEHPWATVVSWLPMVLLWMLLGRNKTAHASRSPEPPDVSPAPRWLRLGAISCGFLLAWGLVGFDPGRVKGGSVWIDESHGEWEATDVPFDRETFGQRSLYSYTAMREILGRSYEVRTVDRPPIDTAVLEDCDVLVLKTPTRSFDPLECQEIVNYVAGGGGLLLVGDHTNVMSMNAYLNQIVVPLGFQFRADHAFSPRRQGRDVYHAPHPWFRHAAVMAVDDFVTLDGCTLLARSQELQTVLFAPHMISQQADYATTSFFANAEASGVDVVGPQRLAAARPFGRGRVMALCDSTIFSNFTMYDRGRRELLLGAVNYLNHENVLPGRLQHLALMSGVLGILVALALGVQNGLVGAGGVASSTVMSFLVGAALVGTVKVCLCRLPERQPGLTAEVWEGRDFVAAETGDSKKIFLALARWGLEPERVDEPLKAAPPTAVVMIDPQRQPTGNEQERLAQYVKAGGKLLVLNRGGNPNPFTRDFLRGLGIRVFQKHFRLPIHRARKDSPFSEWTVASSLVLLDVARAWTDGNSYSPAPEAHRLSVPVVEVSGGEPLFYLGDIPVAAQLDVGAGRVVVAGLGENVSDLALGEPVFSSPSDKHAREHHEVLFTLMDALWNGHPSRGSRWRSEE